MSGICEPSYSEQLSSLQHSAMTIRGISLAIIVETPLYAYSLLKISFALKRLLLLRCVSRGEDPRLHYIVLFSPGRWWAPMGIGLSQTWQ